MLEKYEKDFDENEFMRSFMERKQISTKKQALAELRKLIKKEGYYQTKIKEALKKRYPDAFVAKISQGAYSQAGIPDVMFIKDGHYFGFEVKRPVVGIRSKLQEQTARMIQAAGGTAVFVCWPEEAIREVEEYEKSQEIRMRRKMLLEHRNVPKRRDLRRNQSRRSHRNGNRADHSLSNDSHGSNHRDRRSNHADLVNICRIRRKRNGER